MFDLTGKTALVTGATGAIGAAIARALHAQGAYVVLSGTREAVLHERAEELGARTSAPIDILVANAGITKDGLLLRMKDEDWAEVLRVNLESYFRLSRAAMRGMMKRRYGRIIGITSVVGVTGNPGQANYAASKAGMIGFSKALGQEVATRGITVNCVAPGFIESPMTDGLTERQKAQILASIPTARLGTGADVAAACVYLASDEAAYVTGQTLHVNGGMAMI
jgi:3-oxoacyl-[acyl-carrier protein] reductase